MFCFIEPLEIALEDVPTMFLAINMITRHKLIMYDGFAAFGHTAGTLILL